MPLCVFFYMHMMPDFYLTCSHPFLPSIVSSRACNLLAFGSSYPHYPLPDFIIHHALSPLWHVSIGSSQALDCLLACYLLTTPCFVSFVACYHPFHPSLVSSIDMLPLDHSMVSILIWHVTSWPSVPPSLNLVCRHLATLWFLS